MNELFEKIATEVFFDESTNGEGQKMYTFGDEKMQKFAERIVQECCVTADANIDDSKYPSYWIKKKFGVEQ